MILSVFRRGRHNHNIRALYGAIVAQARSPAFYTHCGVADSVDGRFELIVLHLVLLLRRLGAEPEARQDPVPAPTSGRIRQHLFDLFCRDLDDNLREMGVGDLAVPREMRKFGEAFYGRQAAYGAALDASDEDALEKALARNILGVVEASGNAARLGGYARAAAKQLAAEADDALLAGRVVFPDPEIFLKMPEHHKPAPSPGQPPWQVPWRVPVAVEDVTEEGQHFDLTADADTRAAVARIAGLRDLPRLEANFDVTRHGQGGLRVAGRVSATVGQSCVVTLEPLANEVVEDVDLVFLPRALAPADDQAGGHEPSAADEAEMLRDGSIDLGALATEFLILGLDPYPRKPGAVFQPPADAEPDEGPFAGLAALKSGQSGGQQEGEGGA
jgi:uncharacterized metal-binding protein YceD (DUF177 family)